MSVRHALLALLSDGPKYGLQLRNEFEARTGEVWPLNVGQVYTTLQRLERDGLVESDGADDGPQKGFAITADGRTELLTWLRTPDATDQPPRDELLIKVLVAVEVPGVDVGDVIQAHRRQLIETMQRYTTVKADAPADDVALALVIDAELFRIEAAVRWLDSADAPAPSPPGRRRPPGAERPDDPAPSRAELEHDAGDVAASRTGRERAQRANQQARRFGAQRRTAHPHADAGADDERRPGDGRRVEDLRHRARGGRTRCVP